MAVVLDLLCRSSTPRFEHLLLRVILYPLQFVELHGDRGGLDDPAMVCGLGSIDGVSFMFIGHQKGRNTKVGERWRMLWGGLAAARRARGAAGGAAGRERV